MGGGKALINAYYRSAQELGIEILYNTKIKDLQLNQGHFEAAIAEDGRVFKAKSCVLAAGGFESNLEWLREAWGKMKTANGLPIISLFVVPVLIRATYSNL